MNNFEVRSWGVKLELRTVNRNGFLPRGLQGYAVLYDSESRDFGGWREVISRGAMADCLKRTDIRMLYQHDTKHPMARMSAGTLTVREDNKGVYFEADLVDNPTNREALSNIEVGNVDAMSFGMPPSSIQARWERDAGRKIDVRTITKADIVEISPVTWEAYEGTSVTARGYDEFLKSLQNGSTPAETLRNRLELAKRKYRN